jgi:hypothetical protein
MEYHVDGNQRTVRRTISKAADNVQKTAKSLTKKAPKAISRILSILHIPYFPPIAQHGKRGWLVRYIMGPYDVVSS